MPLFDSGAFLVLGDVVKNLIEPFSAMGQEVHCQVARLHNPAQNYFARISRAVALLQFFEGGRLSPLGSVLVV